MPSRLQIQLPDNWFLQPQTTGPVTLLRDAPDPAGSLQVSIYAEYTGGAIPAPTDQQLVDLAKKHGQRHGAGELVETNSGTCKLGMFGTAIFHDPEFPFIQFWYLSNGYDFVLATFVCEIQPGVSERKEAEQIVAAINLAPNPDVQT